MRSISNTISSAPSVTSSWKFLVSTGCVRYTVLTISGPRFSGGSSNIAKLYKTICLDKMWRP
jgi:hypothetical protein